MNSQHDSRPIIIRRGRFPSAVTPDLAVLHTRSTSNGSDIGHCGPSQPLFLPDQLHAVSKFSGFGRPQLARVLVVFSRLSLPQILARICERERRPEPAVNLSTPVRNYGDVFSCRRSLRPARKFGEEDGEVSASEGPLERPGRLGVVLLEAE